MPAWQLLCPRRRLTLQHHLKNKLKALRLSGVLDTLEVRVKLAEEQHLGFVEFLDLLLQDEVERREARRLAQRLRRASFEEEKTIEGFDFSFNPQLPARQIKELATCQFLAKKLNVFLCGPAGVGKTHISQALGHAACRMGYSVRFLKASQFYRLLNAARADHSWEKRLLQFVRPDLLILDDFGLKPLTAQQGDDLQELVDQRHLKGGFILTSNRRVAEWLDLFPDPVTAHSVLDRIAHNAHQVVIEGESYRKARGLGPPTEVHSPPSRDGVSEASKR